MKKAITTTLALMLTLSAVMNSASAAQTEDVSSDTASTQITADERVYASFRSGVILRLAIIQSTSPEAAALMIEP